MNRCLFMLLTIIAAEGMAMASEVAHESFEATITKKVSLKYMVSRPDGYDPKCDVLYPAILFLHGAGERGDDLAKVRPFGPLSYADKTPGFPFLVIAPQCPDGQQWSSDELVALLDRVQQDYRIDPNRVYLTGYSMGGIGTWTLAMDYPERFAAIAPVCGRAVPLLGYRIYQKPIWVFHGEKDQVISVDHSREMVDALRGMGAENIEFTVYPDAGHDVWTATYNNPALYEWFLKHSGKKDE